MTLNIRVSPAILRWPFSLNNSCEASLRAAISVSGYAAIRAFACREAGEGENLVAGLAEDLGGGPVAGSAVASERVVVLAAGVDFAPVAVSK